MSFYIIVLILKLLKSFQTFIVTDGLKKKLIMSDPEIRKILEDYSLNSTIAGLHYAFESKQSRLGRIVWLFSIIILTTLFIYISVTNYIEWEKNPVTTTVASTGIFGVGE
jgi:uncharacterized protein YybS (DUF2232 family)